MDIFQRFVQYFIDVFKLFFACAFYEALFYFILIACVILLFLKVYRRG